MPLVPSSPRVKSHNMTVRPSCTCLATVPPRPISISSGCGPKIHTSTSVLITRALYLRHRGLMTERFSLELRTPSGLDPRSSTRRASLTRGCGRWGLRPGTHLRSCLCRLAGCSRNEARRETGVSEAVSHAFAHYFLERPYGLLLAEGLLLWTDGMRCRHGCLGVGAQVRFSLVETIITTRLALTRAAIAVPGGGPLCRPMSWAMRDGSWAWHLRRLDCELWP